MPPQSAGPVQDVAVTLARVTLDLHAPLDQCVIVLTQSHTTGLSEVPLSNAIGEPVSVRDPMTVLVWVTPPAAGSCAMAGLTMLPANAPQLNPELRSDGRRKRRPPLAPAARNSINAGAAF